MNRILLVNPNWTGISGRRQRLYNRRWPPLDLAVAAALLREKGLRVRILDNAVHRYSPAAVGRVATAFDKIFVTSSPHDRWQCPATDITAFFDTLRHLPRRRLYLLGAHASERPEALLQHTRARAVIIGEPERTIVNLAMGDTDGGALQGIAGIAFLKGGACRRTPSEPPLDMARLPFPAFDRLTMAKYRYEVMGRRFAVLEGSRGCPSACHFCYKGMHGPGYRQKPADRLVEETVHVANRFGVRNIYYMDLAFGCRQRWLERFCEGMIRMRPGVNWCCQMRVSDLTPSVVCRLRAAGCVLIHLGIETGVHRLGMSVGKPVDLDRAAAVIAAARRQGIRTVCFFNFGFPGETDSDRRHTLRAAVRLDPTYAAFHWLIPYPGTLLARRMGIDPEAGPLHRFGDGADADKSPEPRRVLRRAYLRFYVRPAAIRQLITAGPALLIRQAAWWAAGLAGHLFGTGRQPKGKRGGRTCRRLRT